LASTPYPRRPATGRLERAVRASVPVGLFRDPPPAAAAPHLSDGGSVILNGSVISVLGNPGYAAYAASKAGVRAMARVMASELSPRGIRVNVVSPGGTSTPIWNSTAPTPEAMVALESRIAKAIPLGRFGKPEQVAKPCCSSPATTHRTFRAQRFSSMAAPPHLPQGRRSIAAKTNGNLEITNPISTIRRKIASHCAVRFPHPRDVFLILNSE
jgi:Enoyl-(Acyl carrier protein) reductase